MSQASRTTAATEVRKSSELPKLPTIWGFPFIRKFFAVAMTK